MNYYKIETSGNLHDRSLCVLSKIPVELKGKGSLLRGYRIGNDLLKNMNYYMDDRNPGTGLCPLLGNLRSLLLVSSEIVTMIQQVCDNEIEYLPFTLYDHDKRVVSEDYFFVNPIHTFDCLNTTMEPSGELILDLEKLKDAPHLFRIKDFASNYVMDSVLIDLIKAKKYPDSNIIGTKLEIVPA